MRTEHLHLHFIVHICRMNQTLMQRHRLQARFQQEEKATSACLCMPTPSSGLSNSSNTVGQASETVHAQGAPQKTHTNQ